MKRWPVVTLLAAAMLGVKAVGLAAQEHLLANRLDTLTRRAVEAVIDTARGAGLPIGPLVNKALEGSSKGAPGPRIVAAVRVLASELSRSRAALGEASETGELVAGAAALRSGVPVGALIRVRAHRPGESVAVYLAVLADLVAAGVPADTAVAGVLALADARARDNDVLSFRQSVERDIALGAPAGLAAATRVNATVRAYEEAAQAAAPGGAQQPPSRRRP